MEITPDIINGTFELVGAIFSWKNFVQLRKDKSVKGVYWPTTAFFAGWGFWNIYFYSNLNQWFSFAMGIFLALANLCWTVQAVIYVVREKKKEVRLQT